MVSTDTSGLEAPRGQTHSSDTSLDFLPQESAMAGLIRNYDWAATPLGHPSQWSPTLRMIVRFVLAAVPDDAAPRGIGGVLGTVHENTEKVIAERRVRLMSELSTGTADAKTDEQACAQAITILATHPKDVPFALIYLRSATRACSIVTDAGVELIRAEFGAFFYNSRGEGP